MTAQSRPTLTAKQETDGASEPPPIEPQCQKCAEYRHELERLRDLVGEIDAAIIDELLDKP
jgi:hypothetical protein